MFSPEVERLARVVQGTMSLEGRGLDDEQLTRIKHEMQRRLQEIENPMARGVHGGNESAGGIGRILGAAQVSGSQSGGRGAEGAAFQRDECADIKRCANDVGKTEGANPGNAPHRGLTQAGVVETFIQGTMGQSSLTPNPGPIPTSFVPTAILKK